MADPIEIIQTVISVSKEVCSAIKSIKGAPDELKALDDEVSRMLPILEHLFMISGSCTRNQERDASALRSLYDEARKLVEWAKGSLGKNDLGGRKLPVKKWTKWLLDRSNRKELVTRFEKLNSSVVTYLSYDNHRALNRLQENVNAWMIILSSQLQDIRCQQSLIQQQRQLESVNDAIQTAMRCTTNEPFCGLTQHYTTASPRNIDLRSDPCGPSGNSDISASKVCPANCGCRCHGRFSAPFPRWIRPAVGNVFIHHYWLSVFASDRKMCNDSRCRRDRSNLLRIKYYCPTWFAQISMELQTQRIPVHFCIQTSRVVHKLFWLQWATLEEVRRKLLSRELTVNDVQPDGYSVLHAVTWRLIFDRSEAALSIAGLLIEHSAPIEWEWKCLTPAEQALWWSFVLWRRSGSLKASLDALHFGLGPYLRLDIEEAWEELATKLRWTDLHRRVCSLPSRVTPSAGLSSLPRELISQINTRDYLGWTPLLYAMFISPAALFTLLQAGADLRINHSILAWAARAGADIAISMLVRAGAYVNASDLVGRTALHWGAFPDLWWCMGGLSVALELVRHAGHLLDWTVQDGAGETPLDFAQWKADTYPADEDSQRSLELYRTRRLPDGAQYLPIPRIMDAEDNSFEDDATGLPPTSLIRASLRGDIDAIGDLVGRGAMVNERDQDGRTLLHLAALGRVPNGYRVALELVRHGGWGVDWNACTVENKTALKITDERLEQEELSDAEREDANKLRGLLQAKRLPDGKEYLWPCMDSNFYSPPIPGAWE